MSKRLLVLGGTEFVGRAVAEEALEAGWEVDVLNRGSKPPLPGTRSLVGDRSEAGGLDALASGDWDVVVDTWSWAPYAVRDAATMLKDRAAHYVYISSRSVYAQPEPVPNLPEPGGQQHHDEQHREDDQHQQVPDSSETAPVVEADPNDRSDDDYAKSKAGGEAAAINAFGDRALLLRAGLILGPYENVGRLPWWLNRIAEGGRTLAPEPKDAGLQYIDARDLAKFALRTAAAGIGGAFNTVSPPGHTTMAELLQKCIEATGADVELCWRDPDSILRAGIQPWVELPIWLPPGDLYRQLHQADVSKAERAGLVCRPIEDTVNDTWQWLDGLGSLPPVRPDRPPRWLTREKEQLVL